MSARRRGRYIPRDGTGRDDEDGEEREPDGRRGVDAGGPRTEGRGDRRGEQHPAVERQPRE